MFSKNTILAITSFIASFLLAELSYRYIIKIKEKNEYSTSPTGNQYIFYQFDEKLGWSNQPLISGIYKRKEFEYSIYINSDGMRQKEIDPKNKSQKIAVLGDSFVWGIGVSDEQRFTEILQAKHNNKIQVLNFGVSGYAPVQYYLMIDTIIKKFNPDIFVIALCSNDFGDNVFYNRYGYYKPYFYAENIGDEITLEGYPIYNKKIFGTNVTKRKNYQTFLGSKILATIANMFVQLKPDKELPPQKGFLSFKDEDLYNYSNASKDEKLKVEKAVYINQQIIKKINEKLQKSNRHLVVISSSSKCDYDSKCENNGQNPNYALYSLIEKSMEEINVPFVNTLDIINSNEDFWETDGHWNLSGQKKTADALDDYLIKNKLLKIEN